MTERTLVFRTPPDGVDVVHDRLAALWSEFPGVSDTDRMMFETALIELTSNIVQHGSSDTTIVCRLDLDADDDALRAVLVDTAEPPRIDIEDATMPDELAESGRGLALISAMVDEFRLERDGGSNVWTIVKTRSSPPS